MRSRHLVTLFENYIDELATQQPVKPYVGPIITVFGTDEFRLDRTRAAINLAGVGWVNLPEVPKPAMPIEWIGVTKEDDGWIVWGGCGNPFTDNEMDGMRAIPHAVTQAYIESGRFTGHSPQEDLAAGARKNTNEEAFAPLVHRQTPLH
jgi:hypothetical protein